LITLYLNEILAQNSMFVNEIFTNERNAGVNLDVSYTVRRHVTVLMLLTCL